MNSIKCPSSGPAPALVACVSPSGSWRTEGSPSSYLPVCSHSATQVLSKTMLQWNQIPAGPWCRVQASLSSCSFLCNTSTRPPITPRAESRK